MDNHVTNSKFEAKRLAISAARAMATMLLFAIAFFVVQRLTFTLRFPPYQRTTIWTPGALTFTALLLAPPNRWWIYYFGLCMGAFAAYYGDVPIPATSALLAAQFHFPIVAAGAWAVRRYGTMPPFGNVTSLVVFSAIALFFVPLFTTAPVDLVRLSRGEDYLWGVAVRSILNIALGTLIATPALTITLASGRRWLQSCSWKRIAEILLLFAGLVAVVQLSFGTSPGRGTTVALLYAPLPLLLWAAMRFELAGVTWALLLVGFQSTWAAILGHGPFASDNPAANVLQLQFYLLAIALPLMFLAVVVQERSRAYAALNLSDQEVRQQFAQLAVIYNTAPIGLAFINTDLCFVRVNDYVANINGLPAEAHIGRPLREVVPQIADKIEPVYRRVIQTGEPIVDVELHGVTDSLPGIERDWLVHYHPVRDHRGNILGVTTVVQEITERRQIEEARQELAHASRLAIVGELTASIAHEINQPLGAILSNADAAEMLLESSPASLNEVREILDDIRKDDLRATEVIRRLRRLLRRREMELQPLDLNELIAEVLRLVRAESARRGVKVRLELADNLPYVQGDSVHLQQVLLNVFLNGMDAMAETPGEKTLAIHTAMGASGSVEIAVSDTGSGVAEEQLSHLFDPFFSTKEEGMGLGLAISRSLVESQGGRIWAKNNTSGGATFWITLPAHVGQLDVLPLAIQKKPVDSYQ